ncbi:ureidoglycolate hydrolase [Aspergillus stella-maris]|uniref:ureidoglycolate hydrolase n=1 Tax=Aspergillus stella-maris TaxID=1810926 RepID=UPI003CCD1D0E
MAPPILHTSPSLTLIPEPLTRESFAPFGTAIIPPLPRTTTTPPSTHPKPDSKHIPEPVFANQGSALKYSPISPLTDYYKQWNCPSGRPSEARMSMFSCFPRTLKNMGGKSGKRVFDVGILERHPFTTQTFTPLGLAPDSETFYLVIVAPSLAGQAQSAKTDEGGTVTIFNPPDLSKIRAFVARGDQAVTYGAGTWHAPMVVLGRNRVDFVVCQFVNGVVDEDVQEVRFPSGVIVEVGGEEKGRAKL